MNNINNIVDSVIKEFIEDENQPIIEITPSEQDERSGMKREQTYDVNYQKNINGEIIEIEGILKPYHTGRSVEYGFEPGYFSDSNNENYWDSNWETIEEEIRDKFYSQKY